MMNVIISNKMLKGIKLLVATRKINEIRKDASPKPLSGIFCEQVSSNCILVVIFVNTP